MLKAVMIDNDTQSVAFLKEHLNLINIVKVYESNDFKLQDLEKLKPEIILMNISASECIHIGLIQYISEHRLSTHLVFIKEKGKSQTADPLLGRNIQCITKPYTNEKIAILEENIHGDIIEPTYPKIEICLFKYFHFKADGDKFMNVKWRTTKSRELLVYLLQHYRENVRKDVLIELLWPDTSVEKAYDNLYAAVYYLRKLLRELNIGIHINNNVHGYELEFFNVSCDVLEFRQLFEQLKHDLDEGTDKVHILKLFKQMEHLYIGEYLEEESYVWKENIRDKCRIQFLSIARRIIDYLNDQGEYTEAILIALHLQKLYSYMDYSYFVLMKLYNGFGDMANVEREYKKLKDMLHAEFNAEPNSHIKEWYQNWMKLQSV